MALLKAAMWVHGTAAQVEFPTRLLPTPEAAGIGDLRRGDGATFQHGLSDPELANNFFQFPLPTPVILDGVRPLLDRVFVLYKTEVAAHIVAVRLFDGANILETQQILNLDLSGDHRETIDSANNFPIRPRPQIFFGLNIQVEVSFLSQTLLGGLISFSTVGADFITIPPVDPNAVPFVPDTE